MNKKLKILHLEDLQSDADLIRMVLKKGKINCEIIVVDAKETYITALKDFNPDVVLSDHTLPSFDSHEALAILQESGLKIPFILVTTTVSEEFAVDVINRGAEDYILKDRPERLPSAIQNALEKYRMRHEKEAIINEVIKSESRLKQTQAMAHLGSWELDYSTGIAIWSDEQLSIYGLTPGEYEQTNKSWMSFVHLEDKDYVANKVIEIKSGLKNLDYYYRIIRRNGTIRYLYAQNQIKYNAEGLPIGLLGVTQDVTGTKKAERALMESESNLQAIFENTSDGFILADSNGIIKSLNNKCRDRILLNSEKEIHVGDSIFDFIHESRKDLYKDSISKVLAGEVLDYDYPYTRKNGETKWFHFTVNPVYNGKYTMGISITSSDITQRKIAEEQLRESELFNKGILASLHSHIAVINDKGTLIAVNKAWNDFAGENGVTYLEQVSTGSNYFEVCKTSIAAGDMFATQAIEGIQSVFNKEAQSFELEYPCHSSIEKRWFTMYVSKFGNDDSKVVISHINITERKIAEQKSIQSEKQSRDLFEQSIVGLALARMDGTFADVNDAFAKIIGRTIEESKKLTYWEITPEKYLEQENEILKELIDTGKFMNYEKEYIHKKGYLVPVRSSGSIIEKEGEKFIWSSIEDITEKKKLENAVEAERDQFFNMFLNAPSAIGMLKGADHVFEMVNPLYLQLIGRKDVIEKTVAEVLPEVIEQGFIDILDMVYSTGKSYTGNEVLLKIDKEGNGELTDAYLNFVYQPYKNNKGNIEGIFFFANDITEQIQSRKAIEKSEKFFKGVIENSDDMITMLGPTGKTIYASPAVSKKFGYTNEECLNINIADILHPDDALIMQEFVMKLMMHPGVPMECPLIRERKKDGTYIWVEGTLANFLETDGINAIVANFRDVTEPKKAVELIVRSEANLNAIIENTEANIYSLDRDLRYITFNKNLYNSQKQIYGLDIKPGDNVYNFLEKLSANEASEWKKIYAKALKGETVKFEKKIRNDDYHGYIDFSIHPIWENKKVIGLSCFAIDITKQKKADEKDRFKARLLNTIGQAAVATDLNGIINYWNQAAEDIYGWTQEEAIGKNIIDLTPSEATTEQGIQIMERLKRGETWSGEFKVRKKDGTNFPAHVTDSPIYDENKNLSGIIGISSDITEKKKLEELLDKSNRLARIGSWEIDVKKRTVFWSDITKEIREADPDFVPDLPNGIQLFKEGSHRDTISKRVKDCIEKGIPWDDELQIITQKGNLKWIRTIGEGEIKNGKCIRVYGSFQDIDARKKAEMEVLKAYEEKNVILESIGDGFFAVDTNWVVTYWNIHSEKMLGRLRSEMIGKNLLEVYPNNVDSLLYVNFKKAIKENSVQHFESYSEKLKTWFEISAYPSATGLSVFFKDLTDRKQSQSLLNEMNENLARNAIELAHSNAELEQFAYVASHDLQEPLRMITSFLTLLEKKYKGIIDDKGQQYIDFAVDGGVRMRQIIIDLLEFSRVGRTEDKIEMVDLNEVVHEILSLQSQQIQDVHAVVKVEKLPSLLTYKTPMRQVFQNLINNGLKYHRAGVAAEISISVSSAGKFWQFAISDNGIGIGEAYLDKIFIIFQRLHNSEKYTGTGIGLPIAKKIIERMGGGIWVESKEGKGSTFYFKLPKEL